MIYVEAEKILEKIAELTLPGTNDYQLGYNKCLDDVESFVEHSGKGVRCAECRSYNHRTQMCDIYGGYRKKDDFCSRGRPIS